MKILLINPPIREWAKPNIVPLGLGYIAAILQNAGYTVEIMDINAYRWNPEEVEQKIKQADFNVVGIGAIVTVYKYVKWLTSILKKYHPTKKIIIGGSVGTSVPEIILKKTEADIVCVGEGERTILNILDSPNGKRRKSLPIKNLDEIPFPAWDLFPMDIYLKNPVGAPNKNKWINGDSEGELSMNVCATRGCPYRCIYCYHDFMGQGYRYRSVRNIISEMQILHERYGVTYIDFVDDEFCFERKFVYEFCKEVKSAFKGRMTWGCAGRVNLMTEDLIATMVDSGCVLIGYGIESGSQKMLDVMKKGVTVEQSKEAVRLTKKYLGWADCSFMIGTPGETKETIQETVDFCKELELTPEAIFFMTPYPGTEIYCQALEQGKIKDEEEYVLNLGEQGERVGVNFTDFSNEELIAIQERMLNELNAWNKIKHYPEWINRVYLNTNPKCEPHLTKYGLYDPIGGKQKGSVEKMSLLWVLNLSDGSNSLLDIAIRSKISFNDIKKAVESLLVVGLLKEVLK